MGTVGNQKLRSAHVCISLYTARRSYWLLYGHMAIVDANIDDTAVLQYCNIDQYLLSTRVLVGIAIVDYRYSINELPTRVLSTVL